MTGSCKAKDWAQADWGHYCSSWAQQECGFNEQYCVWDTGVSCQPASGAGAKAGPIDIAGTCSALGELGACSGVSVCSASQSPVCRATDDAIALDPQWQQLCPQGGTSPEACDALGPSCIWDTVQSCTPRGSGKQPLDVGTACKTLGQAGACGVAPTVCKPRTVGLCSALPTQPSWEHYCNGWKQQECGFNPTWCQWNDVQDCIPVTGSHPDSVVDSAKACDTFGQLGMCSRTPICKVVPSSTCRATPAALVADPAQASACASATTDKAACDFLGPSCAWVPVALCIPR
jgi:hypothetical protein